ncbi:unnamed protein product [Rotaria sp. Silwood1]|nr:unnamed protein product [Rotaria sp. Silwood1]CAF0946080.1 unnamed protein product [Rotaria sp. Silwood1]CAF3395817.1 unnamed protein product [Rotaria sp. Silwood1]CAF3399563.1 unnamed protein product [Rotaria sp. Silwood1]CAF4594172.1 unnamed protein product [Rotaria sp. Silwood1]
MTTIAITSTDIYLSRIAATATTYKTVIMNKNESASTTITELSSLDDLCQNFHLIVFLCIIFVLIVSANISVILQLSCSKKRHSRMSFFLLNLAYADLFVGIIIVTRDIIEKSCIPFGLGSIGCRLTSFIQGTISYNSSYVLVCVSIDRLYAIIRPMDVRTASSTFRYSLIAASWVIAMTFASAQLYLRDIEIIRGMPVCGNRSDVVNWNAYVYFLFISLYLVPLIVMTVSYIVIIVIIWQKSSVVRKDGTSTETETKQSKFRRLISSKRSMFNDDRQMETSIRNVGSLGVIPRAKIKTVKMTLVIVIAFTACWSPYFLLMIMNSLNLIQNYLLIRVTSSLCYMNSLANPLIYWLFATDFCYRCRQNCGCNYLTRRSSDGINAGRWSLTESRYSTVSAKHPHRRSNDDCRLQKNIRVYSNRQSNYRLPPASNQSRTIKHIAQHRSSQSSLLYGYQHRT